MDRWEAAMISAGDPMAHDLCIFYGNESQTHWYAVIVDNRAGKKKVSIVALLLLNN